MGEHVRMLKLIVLAVVVGAVVLLVLASRRPADGGQAARDRQELEASRDLIRALLADAVEVSDVDPVLAPKVIDRIRAHQRSLGS